MPVFLVGDIATKIAAILFSLLRSFCGDVGVTLNNRRYVFVFVFFFPTESIFSFQLFFFFLLNPPDAARYKDVMNMYDGGRTVYGWRRRRQCGHGW